MLRMLRPVSRLLAFGVIAYAAPASKREVSQGQLTETTAPLVYTTLSHALLRLCLRASFSEDSPRGRRGRR